MVAVFLIQPRKGFTRSLLTLTKSRAFIEGPYGDEKNLGQYGTIVMLATGIGIAAHLPYLKRLLEEYRKCKILTQRISVHWEMERECK
ncbi:hypothetical protein HOY80DRAFT_1103328, partial [Tuber brumale]